jgi:hypothetical protein
MKLSFKDIQFIIAAIDHLIKTYEERINSGNINDDELADIGNDCMFLEALRIDLTKNIEPNLSPDLAGLSLQPLMHSVLQLPMVQRLVLVDAITESIRQELSLSQK